MGLKAVANPAAGGQPGSFTSLTVSGLTAGRVVYTGTGGLLSASANFTFDGTSAVFAEASFYQKQLALLNTMAEPDTIANRTQIYVDVADGLLKAKNGAGTVQVFEFV